jgi:aspartyl/asparaginyl beta-hydroxylase (cupin superfamily)
LALAAGAWKLHYNTSNYQGGWHALPLYSMNGSLDAIHAVHQDHAARMQYLPTALLQECPYTASLLDRLLFPKQAVRLLRLEAGAIIKEHSDHQLAFEDGEVRLHIPVQTNEQVDFRVQDERIVMNEGELWYLNLSLPHRVSNHGNADRIHLVIDGVVNDWLRGQFAGPDVRDRKDVEPAGRKQFDEQTRLRMIEELRAMGTETALALAENLE